MSVRTASETPAQEKPAAASTSSKLDEMQPAKRESVISAKAVPPAETTSPQPSDGDQCVDDAFSTGRLRPRPLSRVPR